MEIEVSVDSGVKQISAARISKVLDLGSMECMRLSMSYVPDFEKPFA